MRDDRLHVSKTVALLFGSGLCALAYQVVWQREFRLVFGVSTAATAAVLAIFAGGLGIGSALLGRVADRSRNPLRLYALLEGIITVTAAATPFLLDLVRSIYIHLGGSQALGLTAGTVARLLLAAMVLAIPTVLMGGTLPAAARAIETNTDTGRRKLALLYGFNTLGGVVGILLSTFLTLEHFGVRLTLWSAAFLNAVVAFIAWRLSADASAQIEESEVPVPAAESVSRRTQSRPSKRSERGRRNRRDHPADSKDESPSPPVSRLLILCAAALTGFVFFLMELVWYRMLGPLLGGSVYTFGLVLAAALLGVGVGSLIYGVSRPRRATLAMFSITCLLEAAALIFPYALGDRVAFWALTLRHGVREFTGLLSGWVLLTGIVVFPAALIAGFQFPLLIGLLGQGRKDVGRHVGLAYALNTTGAIAGSLAGGFGLLPLLEATGCWRVASDALICMGAAAAAASVGANRRGANWRRAKWLVPAAGLAAAAIIMGSAEGPTAVWRHSAIGAGLVEAPRDANEERDFLLQKRRTVAWQEEGIESSIALEKWSGNSLIINGKIDGNVVNDAATTIMSGILGSVLKPQSRRGLVIGLGVGSTAGWMASLPDMEKVEVVELEPAVLKVAAECAAGTEDALHNPKVRVHIGDAREHLLTDKQQYDLIFSEPSNPYRAGIASLFTQEFYEAARRRLAEDGLFLQWLQSYQVSTRTVETIMATLASTFPYVETWQLMPNDLLLVASNKPISYPVAELRRRVSLPQVQKALRAAWKTEDLEGFLSHYLAGHALTEKYRERTGRLLNTDDCTRIEFQCARMVAGRGSFRTTAMRTEAKQLGCSRPNVAGSDMNWERVEDGWSLLYTAELENPPPFDGLTTEQQHRATAQREWLERNYQKAMTTWKRQPLKPSTPLELLVMGSALAETGSMEAELIAKELAVTQPGDAYAIHARLAFQNERYDDATSAALQALKYYRTDPWVSQAMVQVVLNLVAQTAYKYPALARQFLEPLREPFVLSLQNENRLDTLLFVAGTLADKTQAAEFWRSIEPNVRWRKEFLELRSKAYGESGDPLAHQADVDLAAYLRNELKASKRR